MSPVSNNITSHVVENNNNNNIIDDHVLLLGEFASLASARLNEQSSKKSVDSTRVSSVNDSSKAVQSGAEATAAASIPVIVTTSAQPPATNVSKPPEVNAASIPKNEQEKDPQKKAKDQNEEEKAKAKSETAKPTKSAPNGNIKKEPETQSSNSISFNGGIYNGSLLNDRPHGRGFLTYADGRRYDGDFVNGMPHGRGRMKYTNGNVYIGDFANGLREGHGTLELNPGTKLWTWYVGEFKADKREGKGRQSFNGGHYEGDWKNNKRNGEGTLSFNHGEHGWQLGTYVGRFIDNQMDGEIKYTTSDCDFEKTLVMENGTLKSETELKPVNLSVPPPPEKKQKIDDN